MPSAEMTAYKPTYRYRSSSEKNYLRVADLTSSKALESHHGLTANGFTAGVPLPLSIVPASSRRGAVTTEGASVVTDEHGQAESQHPPCAIDMLNSQSYPEQELEHLSRHSADLSK